MALSRGTSGFEVDQSGALLANAHNVNALRELWASRPQALPLGPGVGSTGAWHVSCHVVAAGCARRASNGDLLWLEVSHVAATDRYDATLTRTSNGQSSTLSLDSDAARRLLQDSTLLGFVEGTSEGHISARGVRDTPTQFGGYLRQNYDQPAGSSNQGGRVWEHWCTTRDLEAHQPLSVSLLTAYLELCHAAGDLFGPTVARGRTNYGHPDQLIAMLDAGFADPASARWNTTPQPIERTVELIMHEATPSDALRAVSMLPWSSAQPQYFMYPRRIAQFR